MIGCLRKSCITVDLPVPPAPAHAVLPPGLTRNYTGVMKQNYTLTIIYLLTFLSRFHTHTHTHLLFTWQESSESPTPHPHLTLLCTSNPPYCRSWKEDTHLLTLLLKLTWTPEMPFFLRKEKKFFCTPKELLLPILTTFCNSKIRRFRYVITHCNFPTHCSENRKVLIIRFLMPTVIVNNLLSLLLTLPTKRREKTQWKPHEQNVCYRYDTIYSQPTHL